MVHNTSKPKSPSYCHATEQGAIEEAKRIAKLEPGDLIVVLQAIRGYQVKAPEPVEVQVTVGKEIEAAF